MKWWEYVILIVASFPLACLWAYERDKAIERKVREELAKRVVVPQEEEEKI